MAASASGLEPFLSNPLRVEVEAHDHEQVELEVAYPLFSRQTHTYVVDVFLFVPRNVGLNPNNYPVERFYQDLTVYLRLDTPPLTIEELLDEQNALSPVKKLSQVITSIEKNTFHLSFQPLGLWIRLFGHSFRESIHLASQEIISKIGLFKTITQKQRDKARSELTAQVHSFCTSSLSALAQFGQLRRRFLPFSGGHPTVIKELFEQIHEYTTAYLIEKCALIASALQEQAALYDESSTAVSLLSVLFRHAERIAMHRKEEGFVNPEPHKPRLAEFFTYRRGLIKKSMQQAFYLDTRTLRSDRLRRSIIAMLAAGLASLVIPLMGFAGGIANWANSLTILVVVITYILRDRLQEFGRVYFGKKLRQYDHDTAIVGESLEVLGLRGLKGRAREKMNWITPDQISAEVTYLRTHPRTVFGSDISTEEVVHYQRVLSVGPEENYAFPPGFAVRDILRFNLRHFFARMDDPVESVRYYDLQKHRFVQVQSPKVYHVNMLIRTKNPHTGKTSLHRYRLILNKEGIVRIEPVENP